MLCGKEYKYCISLKYGDGEYHWQDVACCPEHGGAVLEKMFAPDLSTKQEAEERMDDERENIILGDIDNSTSYPEYDSDDIFDEDDYEDDFEDEE